MNKKLIIINGTMGVGKTETCRMLYKKLENSVWLDGDWCWMMNPFVANQENKEMVINNITYLLRSFLTNSALEYIIFNWVIQTEDIFDIILERLEDLDFELLKISLVCSEENLISRIQKDVELGLRDESCIQKSLERINMYNKMQTQKLDTSELSIEQAVERIIDIIN